MILALSGKRNMHMQDLSRLWENRRALIPPGAGIQLVGQVQGVLAENSAEARPALEALGPPRRQRPERPHDARRLLQLAVAQISHLGDILITDAPLAQL